MNTDLFGNEIVEDELLRDRFMEPPFSVLDTKTESWQSRRRIWTSKGIKSELGRDATCVPGSFGDELDENGLDKYGRKPMCETSIFDPALTELLYTWFCPPQGDVLDPFAGGSVRGIIANYLGYNYTGVELRQEQVDANRQNALEILPTNKQPNWYVGDSDEVLAQEWNKQFDFIFSCPPYFDLEVYSDLPQDLSNMNYDAFLVKYESIIKKAVSLLKPGAYACFVISNVRDKKGFYRNLVGATVAFFTKAGALFYNDAVLLNSIGTACLRAGKIFDSGKKLTKIHQNILVFKKD